MARPEEASYQPREGAMKSKECAHIFYKDNCSRNCFCEVNNNFHYAN